MRDIAEELRVVKRFFAIFESLANHVEGIVVVIDDLLAENVNNQWIPEEAFLREIGVRSVAAHRVERRKGDHCKLVIRSHPGGIFFAQWLETRTVCVCVETSHHEQPD